MNEAVADGSEVEETEGKTPMVNINRGAYVESRTASGGKSLSNGDQVALALEGIEVSMLYAICDILMVENDYLERYAKLNTGMQRMNLGNRIRGFITNRAKENAKQSPEEDELQEGFDALTEALGLITGVASE